MVGWKCVVFELKQLIYRNEMISNKSVFYINNDIQYGSKYISKRLLDIILDTYYYN